MATASPSRATGLCPACLAVLDGPNDACPACRASLRWLTPASDQDKRTPAGALCDWVESGCTRLVARVYTEGAAEPLQEAELRDHRDIRLWVAGQEIGIRLDETGSEAEIAWSNGERVEGTLPLVATRGDIRVCIVQECCPPADDEETLARAAGPVPIALSGIERVVRVGSAARLVGERGIHLTGRGLRQLHAYLAVDDDGDSQDDWVISAGPDAGVWVGRDRVIARKLETGDIVRIGAYLWQYSRANRQLIPVEPIDGVALVLRDAHDRKAIVHIEAAALGPGELIAVTGPSGCGKSTLLEMILHADRLTDPQSIVEVDESGGVSTAFRASIGYVPQRNVHHDELLPVQITEFSRQLFLSRSPEETAPDTSLVLDVVDLDARQRRTQAASLSGGQRRRVQIATQLVRKARLFILDEPTSGLDAQREREVLLQLRALAFRGATVLVAIHGDESLRLFDRVIRLERGRIQSDSCPKEVPEKATVDGDHEGSTEPESSAAPTDGEEENGNELIVGEGLQQWHAAGTWLRTSLWQALSCLRREFQLMRNQLLWRCLIPLLLVPALFAGAIGMAIPLTQLDLLGFLAVLSVIWLSASLAHQAITGERQIFEYERLLALKPVPYTVAKFAAYVMSAVVQVGVFAAVLWGTRALRFPKSTDRFFFYPGWTVAWLMVIGAAGVSVGLLISASCGRYRRVAGIVLPLVMLAQMVFSVEIAGNGDIYADSAYTHFSWPAWSRGDSKEKTSVSREHADRFPVTMSYLTVSRYGDLAVRRIAYVDPKVADDTNAERWRREAVLGMGSVIVIPILLAALALYCPQRERM